MGDGAGLEQPAQRRTLSKGQLFFLIVFILSAAFWAVVTLAFISDPYLYADPNSAQGADNFDALIHGRLIGEAGTVISIGGMVAATMVKNRP